MARNISWRVWASRFLIGAVLFLNLQCAVSFLLSPESYTAGFGVSGVTGIGIVRGMGILFLMWNVPYLIAFTNPIRRIWSLLEAVIMQAIGFIGETFLLLSMPSVDGAILATIKRFIYFDGAGLAALLLALWIARRAAPGQKSFDAERK